MKAIVFALFALLSFVPAASAAPDAGPAKAAKLETVVPAPAPAPEVVVVPMPISMPLSDRVAADPMGSARGFLDAMKEGNWRMVAASILCFLMFLGTKLKAEKWGPVKGRLVLMGLAFAGAMGNALAAGARLDWMLPIAAVGIAWTAQGARDWLKPFLAPFQKTPAPATPMPPGDEA